MRTREKKFENAVKDGYRENGWQVLDSGWPDFLAVKMVRGKRVIRAVEVKSKADKFRGKQLDMLYALSDNIQTYVVSEEQSGAPLTTHLNALDNSLEKFGAEREERLEKTHAAI